MKTNLTNSQLNRTDITKLWHQFLEGELDSDGLTAKLRALTLDQLTFEFSHSTSILELIYDN